MASNQLPLARKTLLSKACDELFGRVFAGYPCPLTFEERVALGRVKYSDRDIEAITRVGTMGMLRARSTIHATFQDIPGLDGAPVGVDFLARDTSPDWFLGVDHEFTCGKSEIVSRLGMEFATKLYVWVHGALQLSAEIQQAKITAHEIIEMARTAGHLHRMVPELYKLAGNPGVITRASAAPYEWAAYPRVKVLHLTNTLAKLSLLAVSPRTENPAWSERANRTWPIVLDPEEV